MIKLYTIFENETEDELIVRLGDDKANIGTWFDVAEILNRLLGKNHDESKYRKRYNVLKSQSLQGTKTNYENISELQKERFRLEEERKKLQTTKLEYNKWQREKSRDELIAEVVKEAIRDIDEPFIPPYIKPVHSDKSYILAFGDEHYGTEFEIMDLDGNIINRYSPEIFEERMNELLNKTVEIIKRDNVKKLYIYSLGDFSDGVIRVSQLIMLRYGVIEGSVRYAKVLANWLIRLSEYVRIEFQMTDGNHTELRMLGQPKGTFKNENTSLIVREFIKLRLDGNPNFEFVENPTGCIFSQIGDSCVLGIHGEEKNMKNSIDGFSNIYDKRIDYLIAGHYHHSKAEDVGVNSEVINIPSIIGADPYSISIKKICNPAAKMMVFEKGFGKVCEHTIKFTI